MTESMIGAVGDAIQKRIAERGGCQLSREIVRHVACAAIEAMRQPTDAALDAGFHKADEIGFLSDNEDVKEVLQAILDAALSEKP